MLSNRQLSDLDRCKRLPEGQLFIELLKMRLAESDKKMRTATGDSLFVQQGKSQALQEVIDDIEQAGDRLARNSRSRQPVLTGIRTI